MSRQYPLLFLLSLTAFVSFISGQQDATITMDNPVNLSPVDVLRPQTMFKLTCSADQVNLDAKFLVIKSLQIYRQSHADGSRREEVAFYSPYNFQGGVERKNIPSNRQWDIDFSEAPSSDIRPFSSRNLKVEFTINDVQCADARLYECIVGYDDELAAPQTLSGQQNTTSQAPVTEFFISLTPFSQNLQYTDGENVTMMCRADGPENLQMSWFYSAPSSPSDMRPYTLTRDITVHPTTPVINDACGAVRHQSDLNIQLQEEDSGFVYVCIVRHDNVEHNRNVTLTVGSGGAGRPAAASSGGNDAGMIVGIVVGVLAFIVIVLLLVYFCWYRKRNESPKDKDTEDNDTKPDMHAPPPVFYSNVKKPPKDDKEDGTWGKQSEASDTWGRKPRYDTYDDDRKDDYNGRKPSSSSTGRQRGRQGSSSSAVRDRDAYPSRGAYDEGDNGYGPESKNDSYDSYGKPRYEKRKSREALNPQAPTNLTDVSGRSEDEASDAPLSGTYGQKPRPKRRTSRPSSTSEDRDDRRGTYRRGDRDREREREKDAERGGDPALHYAQLDLAPSSERERERGRTGRGGRKDQPVEYAEIRV